MAVYLTNVGLAASPTANSLSLSALYKEKLRNCYCANADSLLNATVQYAHGTPVLVGSTVFVPITATITLTKQGNSVPSVFTEEFVVDFQGQTSLPENNGVTITSQGTYQGLSNYSNGKTNIYSVNDSIVVAITPGA